MLVTVEDAKNLECNNTIFLILAVEGGKLFRPLCRADKCMKWRWVNQLYERREAIPPDDALGYCGPARP